MTSSPNKYKTYFVLSLHHKSFLLLRLCSSCIMYQHHVLTSASCINIIYEHQHHRHHQQNMVTDHTQTMTMTTALNCVLITCCYYIALQHLLASHRPHWHSYNRRPRCRKTTRCPHIRPRTPGNRTCCRTSNHVHIAGPYTYTPPRGIGWHTR